MGFSPECLGKKEGGLPPGRCVWGPRRPLTREQPPCFSPVCALSRPFPHAPTRPPTAAPRAFSCAARRQCTLAATWPHAAAKPPPPSPPPPQPLSSLLTRPACATCWPILPVYVLVEKTRTAGTSVYPFPPSPPTLPRCHGRPPTSGREAHAASVSPLAGVAHRSRRPSAVARGWRRAGRRAGGRPRLLLWLYYHTPLSPPSTTYVAITPSAIDQRGGGRLGGQEGGPVGGPQGWPGWTRRAGRAHHGGQPPPTEQPAARRWAAHPGRQRLAWHRRPL